MYNFSRTYIVRRADGMTGTTSAYRIENNKMYLYVYWVDSNTEWVYVDDVLILE